MKVTYDNTFYTAMHEANLRSARSVLDTVIPLIGEVRSVVDVGCGRGVWLKACLEKEIENIFGVDGAWVKPDDLVIPKDRFEPRDFESAFTVGRTGDLAISVEVAEHISPLRADDFIKGIVAVAPAILFSAAIPGQGGTDHRNEQWPAYWIEKFKAHGYRPIDAIRRRVWNNPDVAFFYAQNAILFIKESELSKYPLLSREVEEGYGEPLPLVHPTLFTLIHEDAVRWKLVVPYINWLPLGVLKKIKGVLLGRRR
jgi:hypothetical protein